MAVLCVLEPVAKSSTWRHTKTSSLLMVLVEEPFPSTQQKGLWQTDFSIFQMWTSSTALFPRPIPHHATCYDCLRFGFQHIYTVTSQELLENMKILPLLVRFVTLFLHFALVSRLVIQKGWTFLVFLTENMYSTPIDHCAGLSKSPHQRNLLHRLHRDVSHESTRHI